MQHPQARRIPLGAWASYIFFNNGLSERQLELMQVPSNDIEGYLERLDNETLQRLELSEKQATWLSLAYGHPDIQDDVLMRFSKRLGLQDEYVFRLAALTGRLSLLDKVIESALFECLWGMILSGDLITPSYVAFAFIYAAFIGQSLDASDLIELVSLEQLQAMISSRNYGAFHYAAGNGHLDVMERLIELVSSEQLQDILSSWNYVVFRNTAGNGHLDVMERLIELVSPEHLQDMISSWNYEAFRNAAENGHLAVVNRLLQLPTVFAYAEMHDREYGAQYTHPFVQERLTNLQERRESFGTNNPHAVFDITEPEEAKLCFYMLRNFIRRGEVGDNRRDDMLFLMNIPSVKALLHTAVTPNRPNELLRLAQSVGNQAAADLLLTIPAVHELAQQNNFYRDEAQGGLDLRALAEDRESSMTALTSGEERRLARAIKTYQPQIKQRGGVTVVMQMLRDTLQARYAVHPAHIRTGDGRDIDLPFTWIKWQELGKTLSADTREHALQAYYQQKDHTAFRYLSKPNPWMDNHAPYVHRGAQDAWSTFEEYQPLIAMLYLGACDENTPPCDGYTLETRLERFIDELAHIGRAHNWDNTRLRTDASRQLIQEEYDDLAGDKPSCYSGVKRRLFQSVLGHPLFKILTLDDIKQELRDYVREQFKACILNHPKEAITWKQAWDELCETGQGGDALSGMNISEVEQDAFIESLRTQYPSQFDEDPSFTAHLQNRFALDDQITTHAARFGGEASLMGLLELNIQEQPLSKEAVRAARLRMFSPETSGGEEELKEPGVNGKPGSKG